MLTRVINKFVYSILFLENKYKKLRFIFFHFIFISIETCLFWFQYNYLSSKKNLADRLIS